MNASILMRSARVVFTRRNVNAIPLRKVAITTTPALLSTLAPRVCASPLPATAASAKFNNNNTNNANTNTNAKTNLHRLVAAAAAAAGSTGVVYASAEATPTGTPSKEEIAGCVAAIEAILDEDDQLGPTIVRLAWHASGTYDKHSNTGGSDGATMRFKPEAQHGANAGLAVARDALEPVKKMYPNVSYADLWTLGGAVAIEHMGGPKIIWNPGRRDATDESSCPPEGRLPDADKGQVGKTIRHIREIFYRQGFNDREIVSLIGAHALGRCHKEASGYNGPWTRAPTTFSNEFFRELLENTWTLKKWDGPDQFEDPTGELMMLPTDMALLWDKEFRKITEIYAKDEDTWFKDFAKAFQKLEENGVKVLQTSGSGDAWYKFW